MSKKKNPQLWIAALVATSVATVSYKLYTSFIKAKEEVANDEEDVSDLKSISKKYYNKSIALTLSSLILNLKLPLHDILINSDNVVFILPPNLDTADLNNELNREFVSKNYNYKLMRCSNIQGYVHMLKNLKPDLLLICSDDLGISKLSLSKDLNRFIKQIVNIDQTGEDVYAKLAPIFCA